MKVMEAKKIRRDTKRVFLKKGACSHTFFFLLNREFGHPLEHEERASDPLAGGIVQQGYQCGMLWGATLAIGAESQRRHADQGQAIGMAIQATQHILQSFIKQAKSADCFDITSCDFNSKLSLAKYMLTGKFLSCFKLADKWAPDAFQAAVEGLGLDQTGLPQQPISCASEVIKKMGGSNAETVMVAGFAGGLGLSGNGCGALAAAVWWNTLARVREPHYKTRFPDPAAGKILNAFLAASDYEIECAKICGQQFKTIAEHSEFIKNGGCDKLLHALASANFAR